MFSETPRAHSPSRTPMRSATTFHTKSPATGGRHYSGLDKKPALAEYTTYYSNSSASTPFNTTHSSFHDTTTSSGGFTSGSSAGANAPGGGGNGGNGSVITAFRDLQNKVKIIEQERYDAIRERDSLRSMLIEKKRQNHMQSSKIEMETTESLLSLQATHEKFRRDYDEVNQRIRAQEEIQESIQRKLRSQQHIHLTLQDDVDRNTQRRLTLEKNLVLLKQDFHGLQERCEQVEETVIHTSPKKHAKQSNFIHEQINDVETNIMKIHAKQQKLQHKIQSMESYIDLVIKINGELCDTLVAREEAKARLKRISRSLSPPPRYQWPKEVPYSSVMQVINEAARATAQAAVESTTLHATEMAMKNVIRALTPPRHHSRVDLMDHESSSIDDGDDAPNYSASYRKSPGKSSSGTSSPFASRLNEAMSSLSLHGDKSRSPASAGKHISFDKELHVSEFDNDEDDTSISSDSSSDEGIKRRKKKKSARRASVGANQPRHTLSTTSNRKKSLQNMIARQGAITSATRLAAAAVAASTALKVANPMHSSLSNSTVSSQSKARSRDEAANKVGFIPASGSRSSEFNVVASVSKASRAAKTLNATIASK